MRQVHRFCQNCGAVRQCNFPYGFDITYRNESQPGRLSMFCRRQIVLEQGAYGLTIQLRDRVVGASGLKVTEVQPNSPP